jgi:hypothetical protein
MNSTMSDARTVTDLRTQELATAGASSKKIDRASGPMSIKSIISLVAHGLTVVGIGLLGSPAAVAGGSDSDRAESFKEQAALLAALSLHESRLGSPAVTLEKPKLPPGSYWLCRLEPHTIYLNMIGGQPISKAALQRSSDQWKPFVRRVIDRSDSGRRRTSGLPAQLTAAGKQDGVLRQAMMAHGSEPAVSDDIKAHQASLWAASCLLDRHHTRLARRLLTTSGWPGDGKSEAGRRAAHDMFLLFQHAVFEDGEMPALMKIVEKAWSRRIIDPFDYARLKDRYAETQGGRQLYGTQTSYQDGGPLIDNADGCLPALNERRRALGVEPLAATVRIRTKEGRLCPTGR